MPPLLFRIMPWSPLVIFDLDGTLVDSAPDIVQAVILMLPTGS